MDNRWDKLSLRNITLINRSTPCRKCKFSNLALDFKISITPNHRERVYTMQRHAMQSLAVPEKNCWHESPHNTKEW